MRSDCWTNSCTWHILIQRSTGVLVRAYNVVRFESVLNQLACTEDKALLSRILDMVEQEHYLMKFPTTNKVLKDGPKLEKTSDDRKEISLFSARLWSVKSGVFSLAIYEGNTSCATYSVCSPVRVESQAFSRVARLLDARDLMKENDC